MLHTIRLFKCVMLQCPIQYKLSRIIKLTPLSSIQPSPETTKLNLSKSLLSTFNLLKTIPYLQTNSSYQPSSSTKDPFNDLVNFFCSLNMYQFHKGIYVNLPNNQIKEIMTKLVEVDPVTCVVQNLILQPEYTLRLRQFLSNFIDFLLILFRKHIVFVKDPINRQFFQKTYFFINQYIILTQLNDRFVLNYFIFCGKSKHLGISVSSKSFYINQKLFVDYIVERGDKFQIDKRNLRNVFGYISQTSLGHNYPSKYFEILRILLNKMDNDWYKDKQLKGLRKTILYLEKVGYVAQKVTKGITYLAEQEITSENILIVLVAMSQLLSSSAISYHDKPIPKNFRATLSRIANFISKSLKMPTYQDPLPSQFANQWTSKLGHLIPHLYRSAVWQEDIWMVFADWLQKGQNWNNIYTIDLYIVFRLMEIDSDIISPNIINRFNKTKNFLLMEKNLKFEGMNLLKEYHSNFGSQRPGSYTVQQQICNNLRSVSKKKVLGECLVEFFITDIFVNDKVVIEINGFHHYITNENGEKIRSLKGVFKQRILQKIGYKYLEYNVEDFGDGSIDCLKKINDDINRVLSE